MTLPSLPRAGVVRRFRRRVATGVPLLVWLGAVAGCLFLLRGNQLGNHVTGIAESTRSTVLAPLEGRLAAMLVGLHQPVSAGQVIGRLGDEDMRLRMSRARFELERMKADLLGREAETRHADQALTARLELDAAVELRRLTCDLEAAGVDALTTRAEIEEARVRLQGITIETERVVVLAGQGILSDTEKIRLQTEQDALTKRISELQTVLAQQQNQSEAARRRLDRYSAEHPTSLQLDTVLEPLRWRLREQETQIERLVAEAGSLVLIAPAAGSVESLGARAGEWVTAGQVLVTIADPVTRRILGYVPGNLRERVLATGSVEVRRRDDGSLLGASTVASVSPAMVEMPRRLWRDPVRQEWAWEIAVPATGREQPGELVSLLPR